MTDTATATRVALAVAAPQSPEVELFGAGVQVREQVTTGVHIEVSFDTSRLRRELEAIPLPQLDEAMERAQAAMARVTAMAFAIPPHILRAHTHGSFAPSVGMGPSPVEQVVRALYRPEHWHSIYDWRAPAAWCTPSRRPMTGGRPTSADGGSLGARVSALGKGAE